jgi:glucokinase-like ROK family protein
MFVLNMRHKDMITPNTTSLIYNIIRQNGEINRMGITELSGVSKSTISLQINKLIKLGLIEEKIPTDASQRKLKLRICEHIGAVAGVFLGITKLTMAIYTLDMSVIAEKEYPFDSINDPVETNGIIIEQLKLLCREHQIKTLWGIGIGFPFPVNFREGKPDSPPNVPLWHGYPLKDIYEKEFGCPVLVDNDVNVMALGEGFRGCTVNESDFLFIKAGTGIGSGLIVDGDIYRGANGCAGDIGHIAVDGSSAQCHCGNTGCLEAVAGGKALAEKAKQLAESGKSPYLKAIMDTGVELTAAHISEGAIHADFACIQLIKHAGKAIGEVAAKLVNFFNPSSLVIGGGLTGFGNIFIGAIREAVISRSPHLATYDLNVRMSELEGKAGPIGAGTLILEYIFSSGQFSTTIDRNIEESTGA